MSNFARNSTLNLLFNYSNLLFNVITGVLLVPFYLRKISIDVYGSYLIAVGISTLISLMEFGLSMVLTQRLANSFARSEWRSFRRTLHSGLLGALLLFLLTCLATSIVTMDIIELCKIDRVHADDLRVAFVLLGVGAGINIFLNYFGSIFQALLKAGLLGGINFISAIVGVCTVFSLFEHHPGLTAIASGVLVRAACSTLLLLAGTILALRSRGLLPEKAPLRDVLLLLKSCGPIFIGGVSRSVVENAQNLLLASAMSPGAITILALTQKALQVCNMILAPIGSSIYSNLAQLKEKLTPPDFASLLGIALGSHAMLSVLLITTASAFNETFVTLWVGADKFGGLGLSLLLGLSTLLSSRFFFVGFLIYSTGDFKKPLKLEVSYSFFKILILFLFVRRLGLYAVPISEVCAGFIFFFIFGNRMLAHQLQGSRFSSGLYSRGWLEFALLAGIGCGALHWLRPDPSWPILALLMAAFMLTMIPCILALNTLFVKGSLAFRTELRHAKNNA